jgi:hypothetical protein
MPPKKRKGTTGASTARFAKVVAECGNPELVLLWGEPSKAFLSADRRDRVMTVLQAPAGSQSDYGVVGFRPGKNSTYLLFPNPLANFKDARIVGIKYDLVQTGAQTGALVTAPNPAPEKSSPPRRSSTPPTAAPQTDVDETAPEPAKMAPSPPKTMRYEVTLIFRAEVTVIKQVEAASRAEARRLSEAQVRPPGFSQAKAERRTARVKLLEG